VVPRWINIPNLFTLVRLILVPFVIQAIIAGHPFRAVALFAAAATTDLMDGAAARYLNTPTQAGAYLDPIADKCLLSGVFLALAIGHLVPWWLVGIIFGRDLYILLAVAVAMLLTPVRSFPPSVWGKASTFVQVATAVVLLSRNVLEFRVLDTLSSAMLWPCAAFTIWSGLHYTWRGVQIARAH
jgi:cardiolipin synthase